MKKQVNFYFLLFIVIFLKSNSCFSQWPILKNDYDTTIINTPVIINVKANDTLGPICPYITDFALCCGSFWGPQHGNITILNWDSIKYIPNPGFFGSDTFLYSAYNDTLPTGSCDTGRVRIIILNTTQVRTQFTKSKSFTIYPNPTTENSIQLKDLYFQDEVISIKIYNHLGETVLDLITKDIDSGIVKIDISPFDSGLYLVEVKSEIYRSVEKLVIK